jgi:hypothetical protein
LGSRYPVVLFAATTILCAVHAVLPVLPPTVADPSVTVGPLRPRLQMLEAGIEDRGGIEKSLRVLPVDMRLPTAFQSVYRVPAAGPFGGPAGATSSDASMMRGNGALFAVFPRSLYRRTVAGNIPLTPAGTVYHIGMPGGFNFPGGFLRDDVAPPDPRIATLVDRRVRLIPIDLAPPLQRGDVSATEFSFTQPSPAPAIDSTPAISEAARVNSSAAACAHPIAIADLKLGPPRLVRE